MPSLLHQTLVDLLRHAPGLVPELLGATVGEAGAVRPLDAVLDQLERRVDLALEVDAVGLGPVAVGVEVQLTIHAAKRRSWPVYVTTLRSARCPRALLVVLTPHPRVARWAAQPIDLGPGNESFRVHVLGPEQIPRVTAAQQARRSPELAVLSALSHAVADGDPELVYVALAGLVSLDSTRARSYGSVLLKLLDAKFPGNCEVTMQDAEVDASASAGSRQAASRSPPKSSTVCCSSASGCTRRSCVAMRRASKELSKGANRGASKGWSRGWFRRVAMC
jgi:hypothetical protein